MQDLAAIYPLNSTNTTPENYDEQTIQVDMMFAGEFPTAQVRLPIVDWAVRVVNKEALFRPDPHQPGKARYFMFLRAHDAECKDEHVWDEMQVPMDQVEEELSKYSWPAQET